MKDITQLPQWKCHKVVQAIKIVRIQFETTVSCELVPIDSGFAPIRVDGEYMNRHLGREVVEKMRETNDYGYFVLYADGYQSWSPSKQFEDGYTLSTPMLPAGVTEVDAASAVTSYLSAPSPIGYYVTLLDSECPGAGRAETFLTLRRLSVRSGLRAFPDVDLSGEEAAAILQAHDYGLYGLPKASLMVLDRVMSKLKDCVRP